MDFIMVNTGARLSCYYRCTPLFVCGLGILSENVILRLDTNKFELKLSFFYYKLLDKKHVVNCGNECIKFFCYLKHSITRVGHDRMQPSLESGSKE